MERLSRVAAAIAAVMPWPAFANVGVPTAANMIEAATVIVVGPVSRTVPPSILPSLVLKGSAVPGRQLRLADPNPSKSLAFNLDDIPKIVGATPTVAFGRLEADGAVLTLIWMNASLLPQGYRFDTFASDDVDSIVAFVRRVLGISSWATKDPDATLAAVLRDLEEGRAEAALAWLEVAVERDFGAAAFGVRAAAAAAILKGRPLTLPAARQFADTAHAYPVSLAAPILLRLADGPATERAKPALRSMLTARGANIARGADSATMNSAWRSLAADVRRAEARRVLALFDTPWPNLNGGRADATMELIVGHRPADHKAGLPPVKRKALWASEIESILE